MAWWKRQVWLRLDEYRRVWTRMRQVTTAISGLEAVDSIILTASCRLNQRVTGRLRYEEESRGTGA